MKSASTTNSTAYGGYYNCNVHKRSNWLRRTCFLDELQLLWFITHVLTIVSFIVNVFILMGFNNPLLLGFSWYRFSNYCCIITYSIVIYKRYLCQPTIEEHTIHEGVLLSYVLKTENVQLIICACLWCFTQESIFKLFPFFTYSLLNVVCFFVFDTYPEAPLSVVLAPLIYYLREPMLVTAGIVDIFIIGILIKEGIRSKSVYSLFLYTFVWGLKIENSEASRIALNKFLNLAEKILFKIYVSSQIQYIWNYMKKQLSITDKNNGGSISKGN